MPSRRGFINITAQVEDCLRESGIREGLALVNAMHITASIFIKYIYRLLNGFNAASFGLIFILVAAGDGAELMRFKLCIAFL